MKTHSLEITPDLLKLISELDEFKGTWRAIRSLAPERLAVLRRVATIESIGSSTRIEGAKLTDKEVESLLGRLEQSSFTTRDEQEVAGYAELMETVFQTYETIPITENYIKQFHGMLLRHSTKDKRHRGQYKTLPNNVEAFDANGKSIGVIFETVSPIETPLRMQELVSWTKNALEDKSLHPLLVTAVFIVTFLEIHPFQDGNGRLSRALTSLLLLKSGYSYVPYSSLESVIEQNKDSYYLALRRTQTSLKKKGPDWQPWVRFFLQSLKAQKDRLQAKLGGATQELAALPALSVKILELVQRHGRITTGELETKLDAPRPTIKKRLADLVKSGHLVKYGKGRSTWYSQGGEIGAP